MPNDASPKNEPEELQTPAAGAITIPPTVAHDLDGEPVEIPAIDEPLITEYEPEV